MLDNGAFTAWTAGRPITDWTPYYQWCDRYLEHRTTWAVIPDVMGGTGEENDRLLAEWPHGRRGAPVWHFPEDLERLGRLVEEWPLVCISAASYGGTPGPRWRRRMAQAMDTATDELGRPRCALHLLRGLGQAGGPYPLASADSSTGARNHKGSHRNPPFDLAARVALVDSRQSPARWHRSPDQLSLGAATVYSPSGTAPSTKATP
jgi:hypothetical protein